MIINGTFSSFKIESLVRYWSFKWIYRSKTLFIDNHDENANDDKKKGIIYRRVNDVIII
jgi:hypothetical protein